MFLLHQLQSLTIAPSSSLLEPLLPCPSSCKNSCHSLPLLCLCCCLPHPLFLWLIVVCWVGGHSRVLAELRLPHPPLLLICCQLLLPHVPPPRKTYVVLHCLCCLRPPLGSGIVGGIPPPPITSSMYRCHHCTPPPLPSSQFPLACHSPIAIVLLLFFVFVVASSTPYLLWLVVVCWADWVRHH